MRSARPSAGPGFRVSAESGSSSGCAASPVGVTAPIRFPQARSAGSMATAGVSAGAGGGERLATAVCPVSSMRGGGAAVPAGTTAARATTGTGTGDAGRARAGWATDPAATVPAGSLCGRMPGAICGCTDPRAAEAGGAGTPPMAAGVSEGICGLRTDPSPRVGGRLEGAGLKGSGLKGLGLEGSGLDPTTLCGARVEGAETPSGFTAAGRSVWRFGCTPGARSGVRGPPFGTSGGMASPVLGTINAGWSRAAASFGRSLSRAGFSFTRSCSVSEKCRTPVNACGNPAAWALEKPPPVATGLSPASGAKTAGKEGCEVKTDTRQTFADWRPLSPR
jgi:hypothetical protein